MPKFLRDSSSGVICFISIFCCNGLAIKPIAAGIGVHEHAELISSKIKNTPNDAKLYFKRANFLLQSGHHLDEALADLKTAETLQPKLPGLSLAYARIYNAKENVEKTQQHIEKHLDANPADLQALRFAAKFYQKQKAYKKSEKFYLNIFTTLDEPDLDLIVEWLRQYQQNQAIKQTALPILDKALLRWGPIASLEIHAIELEKKISHRQNAIARIEKLLENHPSLPKGKWYFEMGSLYRELGDQKKARDALVQAKGWIESQPEHRQHTSYAQDLKKNIERQLAFLAISHK